MYPQRRWDLSVFEVALQCIERNGLKMIHDNILEFQPTIPFFARKREVLSMLFCPQEARIIQREIFSCTRKTSLLVMNERARRK